MPRLLRPRIPFETRCRVLLRQLGELWPDAVILAMKGRLEVFCRLKMEELAAVLDCEAKDLHLDHDPALGARQKVFDADGEHIGYIPDANDKDFLIYREKTAHRVKTNHAGEHGQFPDRVLIKRNRKLEGKVRAKVKRKWPSRPFPPNQKKLRTSKRGSH
jgi:hypothetical protein